MFFDKVGKMALGSRLRMLNEKVTADAEKLYKLYNVDIKPKWFPVFYILSHSNSKSITTIAEEIGHSHPSVVRIVREMAKNGLVTETKDKADKRKNIISLSQKGKHVAKNVEPQYKDVDKAVEELMKQTRHNLWEAMQEFEFLLNQKSLFERVREQKKTRESQQVRVVAYNPKYQEHFKKLNEEWINQYFKMEEADRKALDHPQEYILDKGGHILIALYNDEPVGVCALIKMDDPQYDYELAKMAVSPKAQGLGIGWIIGQAIIDTAKSLKAKNVYLESNTILKPAINLYHKLGFKKVAGHPTPYERCNIQMVVELN